MVRVVWTVGLLNPKLSLVGTASYC